MVLRGTAWTMEKVTRLPVDPERNSELRRLQLREINEGADDKAETIGDALRAARLRAGEDLRGVAASLRIRPEHLEALEANAFDRLPGRTYAIGFLRSYAEYLGLDAGAAIARFKQETGIPEPAAAAVEPIPDLNFPDAPEETRIPQGSILIVGALLLLAIWGGYYLSKSADRLLSEETPGPSTSLPGKAPSPGKAPLTAAPGVSQPAAPTASSPAPAAPVASVPAAPQSGGAVAPGGAQEPRTFGTTDPAARVELRALRDVWVRIDDSAAQHIVVSPDLRSGDRVRVPNQAGLILSSRDAGAVELLLDGQSLGAAGKPGELLNGLPISPEDLEKRLEPVIQQ